MNSCFSWNHLFPLELKRTCTHDNSYSLSEFIPWDSMLRHVLSIIFSFFSFLVMLKLRHNVIDYLSKLKIDYSIKLYHSSKTENLSTFIKSLKMKRSHDARDVQKIWSSNDCNDDSTIEFYCNGRLPVFNEWNTENTKKVK
jgi:ERCC4-type nuclease